MENRKTVADDTALISRAKNGDEQAFADVVRGYHAFVYAIVIGIMKDSDDAEEVVQDVFVNAYRGLPQLENASKFKGWLAEIARNCARDRLRGQRVDIVSINEVSEHSFQAPGSPDAQLIRDEQRALIRSVMESLSAKDKEIVKGYYLDGASYDELIRTHGLSYKAISVRLSRAKRKLAKRLRHLLTGVCVTPSMTFKQIGTGGLTVMKIGTVPKITVGTAAIIGIAFIGIHQFISSKEDSSPTVEIVTSTPSEATHSVARTNTNRRTVTAPRRAKKPQITAAEMEQIENFFAQLDEAGTQQNAGFAEVAETKGIFPAGTNDNADDEPETSKSDSGPTPDRQKEVDSIVERLYDGTDEYKRLMEIRMADVPLTPEVYERKMQAVRRIDTLDSELPDLLSRYYLITRDMDGFQQLLPLFEGVIEIELIPVTQEGSILNMRTTPVRFLMGDT